jgi:hypothetical protein
MSKAIAAAAALVGTAALAAPPARPPAHAPAAPTCTTAPGTPVAVTGEPIPLEAIGGRHVPQLAWPAPGVPKVGALRYEWGLMLRSTDRGFADFDEATIPLHSRRSGCWYGMDFHWGPHGADSVLRARIAGSAYREGYVAERPDALPPIAGYRFAGAGGAFSPSYRWIGLWVAKRGKRSLIIGFDGARHETLGEVPLRLAAISTMPSPDTPWLGISLVGENRPGEPVAFLEFMWMSQPPPKRSP